MHNYLSERADVETHSEGDEPDRRLVVSPLAAFRDAGRGAPMSVSRETLEDWPAATDCPPRPPSGCARSGGPGRRAGPADDVSATRRRRCEPTWPTAVAASSCRSCAARAGSRTSAREPASRASSWRPRCPEAQVDLVESGARKCDVIERLARRGRARKRPRGARRGRRSGGRRAAGAARAPTTPSTARAVGSARRCCVEYAAPLLRERGVLVAWKGALEPVRGARGERGRREPLGIEVVGTRRVTPFAGRPRPSPAPRPRRSRPRRRASRVAAGMARKRPLA